MADYPAFPKVHRWNREVVISEMIDGTNGQILITKLEDSHPSVPLLVEVDCEDGVFAISAGSRKRWLTPRSDNHGFAAWVKDNAYALVAALGVGRHYGEWYGQGIRRGYGLHERRFALFNGSELLGRAATFGPAGLPLEVIAELAKVAIPDLHNASVTPGLPGLEVATVLARVPMLDLHDTLARELFKLRVFGSAHVPGYLMPEGLVLRHTAGNHLYKVPLEGAARPKNPAEISSGLTGLTIE